MPFSTSSLDTVGCQSLLDGSACLLVLGPVAHLMLLTAVADPLRLQTKQRAAAVESVGGTYRGVVSAVACVVSCHLQGHRSWTAGHALSDRQSACYYYY